MAVTVNEITVVCDGLQPDPRLPSRHPGKIAVAQVYRRRRFSSGWEQVSPPRPPGRRSRDAAQRRRQRFGDALVSGSYEELLAASLDPRCNQCGGAPRPPISPSELDWLAARGKSRISIMELSRLRLQRKWRQGRPTGTPLPPIP